MLQVSSFVFPQPTEIFLSVGKEGNFIFHKSSTVIPLLKTEGKDRLASQGSGSHRVVFNNPVSHYIRTAFHFPLWFGLNYQKFLCVI